jgi:hypothetical protein
VGLKGFQQPGPRPELQGDFSTIFLAKKRGKNGV